MTVTATRSAGLPERYYAPQVVVELGGEPLDPAAHSDVLEVKVTLSTEEVTSVDLKLNNYDDTAFDLKWSDSPRLRLGTPLAVRLGYAERTVWVWRGVVTTLTPEFGSEGTPTLLVRGLDALVRLKGAKPPRDQLVHTDKADWQIAQAVARRHGLRLEVTEEGPVHRTMSQADHDDAAFLRARAQAVGFELYMRTDPASGEDALHFVRPRDGRSSDPVATYVLAWGTLRNTEVAPSLVEFKPTLAAAGQVQSVTVRGWDPDTRSPIVQTATPENTPGVAVVDDESGPSAAGRLAGQQEREEVVVRTLVTSEEEALELARALLAERAYRFLTAHGKAIGLPDLRPGDNVEVEGVGRRFSGVYHVTKVTHVVNQQGFLTEFDASRR